MQHFSHMYKRSCSTIFCCICNKTSNSKYNLSSYMLQDYLFLLPKRYSVHLIFHMFACLIFWTKLVFFPVSSTGVQFEHLGSKQLIAVSQFPNRRDILVIVWKRWRWNCWFRGCCWQVLMWIKQILIYECLSDSFFYC